MRQRPYIKSLFHHLRLLSLLCLCAVADSAGLQSADAQSGKSKLTIGIFSYFPDSWIYQCCQPLVDYLNDQLDDINVRLKAVNLQNIDSAIADNELDFIVTNPVHFIQLRERYNLKGALATIIRRGPEGQTTQLSGGVIFTRKDRTEINQITDLRDTWIAIAGARHLGAYAAQAYALLQADIRLPVDARLVEVGDYPAVVDSVLKGDIDAGFIPTGILERLAARGGLSLDDVKVVSSKNQPGFPFLSSTRLYPQWPVIALPHVPQELVDEIWKQLQTLPADHPAGIAANIAGFAPPADYHSVEAVIRTLGLAPYDTVPEFTLQDIWLQHKVTITLVLLAALVILLLIQLLFARNQQLRKQRLKAEESTRQFEQIIDATQAGIWKWNIKTNQIMFNDRWTEIIGYSRAELKHATIETCFDITHPQDLEVTKERLQQHFRGDSDYFEADYRMQHKNGHWIWIHSRGKVISWEPDGTPLWMFGTHMDVTHSMEAALALQASQAKYQRLVDNIGEKIVIFSHTPEDGILTYVSKGTSVIFGLQENEIIGRRWSDIFEWHPEDLVMARERMQEMLSGKTDFMQLELRYKHSSGEQRTLRISSTPIRTAVGKVLSIDGIAEDVTEQKRSLERLQKAERQAQAANTAKSEFVANISHEIRTPMNAILGFTDLCLAEELKPKHRTYLENVKASAHNMLSLINEILDFSKIEAGKLLFETIPFDLHKELAMITTMTRQLIHSRNVDLELSCHPDIDCKLIGDPLRLKQVLTNLISNAIKFTENGRIHIMVKQQRRDRDSIWLEFAVCDTGIGMDAEKMAHIFDPFSQADSSTTRKFGGTGLGLSISSQLIQKMGGQLEVESEPGIGSTFYFSLSFPVADDIAADDQTLSSPWKATRHLHGTRILLVEDNSINRLLITEILQQHHMQVDTAEDGQQALTRLRESEYDLVLMDVQMPIMDGYETTWAVRHQMDMKDLPIIALTANTTPGVREKCLRCGMDDYLSKPIDTDELLEKIEKIIQPVSWEQSISPIPGPTLAPDTDTATSMEFPPELNAEQTMKRLALNDNKYHGLLKKFATSHRDDIEQTRRLLKEGHYSDALRLVHTLKGLSGTIGASQLQQNAAQLEAQLKVDFKDHAAPMVVTEKSAYLLDITEHCLLELIHQINLMDTESAINNDSSPLSSFEFEKMLNELLIHTEQYNAAAVSQAETLLHSSSNDPALSEILQTIKGDLDNFDFDSASSHIKTLLADL